MYLYFISSETYGVALDMYANSSHGYGTVTKVIVILANLNLYICLPSSKLCKWTDEKILKMKLLMFVASCLEFRQSYKIWSHWSLLKCCCTFILDWWKRPAWKHYCRIGVDSEVYQAACVWWVQYWGSKKKKLDENEKLDIDTHINNIFPFYSLIVAALSSYCFEYVDGLKAVMKDPA